MSEKNESVSRREFAKQLTVGTATLAAASSLPGTAGGSDTKKDKGMEQSSDKKDSKKEPAQRQPTQADLVLATILQRYPSENFNEEILGNMHRSIRGDIIRGSFLSRFPLKNSDEPGFVFAAYRNE